MAIAVSIPSAEGIHATLGPNGAQPVNVEIAWTSKTVPASDVSAQLADGRTFSLARPVTISDLSVPAANAVDLLNKLVSPYSPRGNWSFKACAVMP